MPKASTANSTKIASLDRVLNWTVTQPWAVTRPMLRVIASVLARHLVGLDAADATVIVPRPAAPAAPEGAGIAIIPLHGVLAPRMNLMSDLSGAATFDEATKQVELAMNDRSVGTIVLDWDSPGGSVAGATEFADVLLAARKVKPIVSHANFEMCSAAYWTGACANEISAAPSAFVGSIGVYSIHEDLSEYLAQAGIKLTYISAGKFKVEGNEAEPLSDHARQRMQANVEGAYSRFVEAVAAGRGASAAAVRAGYGQGDALPAGEALAAGLVDRVETFDAMIARLQGRAPDRAALTAAAAATTPALADTAQDPPPAGTAQDRDRAWITGVEAELLALEL